MKQLDPVARLERLHLHRHRGLGDTEPAGSGGEAAFLRDRVKGLQLCVVQEAPPPSTVFIDTAKSINLKLAD
jgi:hypothetical protein